MDESGVGPYRRRNIKGQKTPYARPEPKKSLLNKMSDSVKELLTPSWLTALISRRSEENNSAVTVKNTDSDLQPNMSIEPNSHKIAMATTADYNTSTVPPILVPNAATVAQPIRYAPQSTSSSVDSQAHIIQQMPTKDSPYYETFIQQPLNSSRKRKKREKSGTSPSENNSNTFGPAVNTQLPTTTADMNKSMMSNNNMAANGSIMSKKPRLILDESSLNDSKLEKSSLNISSFAQSFSQSMNGSILNSSSLGNSSFYPGKTVYGGISSRRNFSLTTSSPYKHISQPKQLKTKAKPTVTSKAAKIILQALDETGFHKSPDGSSKKLDTFSPAVFLRKKSTNEQNWAADYRKRNAPPNHAVSLSSKAKILPNVFKPASLPGSRSDDTMSYSNVQVKPLQPSESSAAGGKLKRDRGTAHYSSNKSADDTEITTPNLPTTFTLPINTSTKIDFGIKLPSTSSSMSATVQDVSPKAFQFSTPKVVSPGTIPVLSPSLNTFSFSSPAVIPSDDRNIKLFPEKPKVFSGATIKSIDNLNASVPVPLTGSKNASNENRCVAFNSSKPTVSVPTEASWSGLAQTCTDKWKCDVCLIQNDSTKTQCIACGSKKTSVSISSIPSEQSAKSSNTGTTSSWGSTTSSWGSLVGGMTANKWSCPDCLIKNENSLLKCVACGSSKPNTTDKFITNEKWKCGTCLIQNDGDKEVCVACQTKKPVSSTQKPAIATNLTQTWGDAYKTKWKCDVCLIQNDSDKDKCVACQTKKPGSNKDKPDNTSSWADIFKPEGQGEWKCDTCMVKNDSGKDMCVACQTRKPTSTVETQKNMSDITGTAAAGWSSSSSPVSKLTGSWGLVGQANDTWKCSVCLVSNKNGDECCVACQTARPNNSTSVPKLSSTWECSTCMVTNASNISLCTACNACKPGTQSSLGDIDKGKQLPLFGVTSVKFGSSSQSSVTTKPLFGSTSKDAPVISSDKLKLPTSGFQFGSNANSAEVDPKSNANTGSTSDTANQVQPLMRGNSDGNKKSQVANPLSTQSTPPTGLGQDKTNSYSDLGSAAKKPAVFQFGVSAKVPSTSQATTVPAFQFGGKTASTKTDTTNQSEKPLFQFGSTAASTKTDTTNQSEKPLFQFGSTAASTKTDTTNQPSQPSFQLDSTTASAKTDNTSQATQPLFQFGNTAANTKVDTASQPALTGFQFGSQPSDSKLTKTTGQLFNAETQPSSDNSSGHSKPTVFTFGVQPSDSKPQGRITSFGSQSTDLKSNITTKPAVFQFGATPLQTSQTDSAKSTFQFGSSSTKPTEKEGSQAIFGSAFGGTSSNVFGAPKPELGTAATNVFGNASANTAAPFTFGDSSNTQTSNKLFGQSEKPVFGMTQPKSTPSVGFQFGAGNAAPSFNFGSSGPAAQNTGTFQFGQPSGSTPAVFQFGASQPNNNTASAGGGGAETDSNAGMLSKGSNGRQIKRATRRLKK